MKYQLPDNHGLSEFVLKNYLFYEDGNPALTDAQYKALSEGVATGESMLVVSPTSTGKTQIAVWAMASALEKGFKCVYLVTHRALASQKFEDFGRLFKKSIFNNDDTAIVLATGDYIIDCAGETPSDPLSAPLVIATYEKYLAMLAATGLPASMQRNVFVCDEVQLLGDSHRGKHVEILVTLLKNAGWHQFLGLSAVLDDKDADDLTGWLAIKKVKLATREKHLIYECWTKDGIYRKGTSTPDSEIQEEPCPIARVNTLEIIKYLLKNNKASFPIIVFCMKKKDVYDLAELYEKEFYPKNPQQLSLMFDNLPTTKANTDLARYLPNRFAIHCADLTDDERVIVEESLIKESIDVVFTTSTLAAGVNFPLGMAVFHSWKRWDSEQRQYVPIDPSEFHNMAGRVGRMGTDHENGRVIFSSDSRHELPIAARYFEFDRYTTFPINLSEQEFKQIILQLVSSGIATNAEKITTLLKSTFSGLKTQDTNTPKYNTWDDFISQAISWNIKYGLLLLKDGNAILATPLGRSVAQSGLLVETAVFLVKFFLKKGLSLVEYFCNSNQSEQLGAIDYALIHLFFSTPEFHGWDNTKNTRFLPWQLKEGFVEPPPQLAMPFMFGSDWRESLITINSTVVACQWINGKKIGEIEFLFKDFSAGPIFELLRNLRWVMQGAAQIISALTDKRNIPSLELSGIHINADSSNKLRPIIRYIYDLSNRISAGVPSNVLWMLDLNRFDGGVINRDEVNELYRRGVIRIEDAMRGDEEIEIIRTDVFKKAKPAPQVKSVWFRESCRKLKKLQRDFSKDRQNARATKCDRKSLIDEFYGSLGNDFEKVFESILDYLSIKYIRLDKKGVIGAPDYLVNFTQDDQVVIELKTKQNDKSVDFNAATEVLAAAEVQGYANSYCITLCHPGVDPSVPPAIAKCNRLTVIESIDLGESLLRVCEGKLTRHQLYEWITRPGQAIRDDLPFSTNEGVFK